MRTKIADAINGVETARPWAVFLVLLVAFSCIAFTGLNGSLQNVDEVLYARVSRETLEHDSWLLQYKDGKAWFHKPPMVYWAVMSSYRLFGVSDFAAKLPSAAAGVVSAFLIVLISRLLYDSLKAAVVSGLLYLVSIQVYFSTHLVAIDSLLVMYLLATLLFAIKGVRGNPNWFLLAGFFNGLAILTKSVLGFAVPSAVLVYIVIERRWRLVFHFVVFFLVGIAVAFPYFFYVYRKIPGIFVDSFLHADVVDRFYKPGKLNPLRLLRRLGYGIGFYTAFLLLFTLPFTPALFFLASRKNTRTTAREVLWGKTSRLVLIYFLVTLIGYSLLAGKWPHWCMPMIPAVILFLGRALLSIGDRKIYLYTACFSAAALCLLAVIVILEGGRYPTFADAFAGLGILYACFVAANLYLFFKDARTQRWVLPLVVGYYLCFTLYTAITVPCDFNRDIKSFSAVVYDDTSPLVVVSSDKVNEGNKKTATIWYLKRWSRNYGSLGAFKKAAPDVKSGTYVIYYREYTGDLQALFPSFSELKRGVIWNIGRVE